MSAPSPRTHARSWWRRHRWLLLRRLSQIAILALFLAGPWLGLWVVKGNLNYSLTLDTLPLTDPYVLLQSVFAGHIPEKLALIGVAIVVAGYLLIGGRSYCAWVCPLNPVTDLAAWLRRRLGLKGGAHVSRHARFWAMAATLLAALLSGTIAWELVNPVSLLHRGLIFGIGFAWAAVLGVFLFDLFVMARGWCGHLCPVGAAYSLLGHARLLQVAAVRRADCDDCNDCFAVCPEPLVIRSPLKDGARGIGPAIASPHCTNCGRCIEVCSKDVFVFGSRFSMNLSNRAGATGAHAK